MKTALTRRAFLKKSLAGAGLTIAVSLTPFGTRLLSAAEAEKEEATFSPNVWLQITAGNVVNVIVNKSEMGQGVYTSLPMIAADELDADWKQVRLKIAPAADKYKDPAWGRQLTGGSTSIRHMFGPLRKAAAAAREMLVEAAAKTWGVPSSECEAFNGSVRNRVTGKKISFGDLAVKAAKITVPQNPALKKESDFTLIGRPIARLDIPAKAHGVARFGIDTSVPGMLYAAIARPPAYGAKPVSYDRDAAMKIKGVSHVLELPDGIAACAGFPDTAWKALDALKIRWDKGTEPGLDNETLEKSFVGDIEKKGIIARKDGDAVEALDKAAKKIDVTYLLPYLCHAAMEPMNCTADVRKDRCDIWVPTQNQTGVLDFAVKETGLGPEQIHVYTTFLGGGYGRRAETDVVEEAVRISKAAGKPVKLIWKREADLKNDFYRPGNFSRVRGGLDGDGNLIAWSHKVVCPSIFARVMPAAMKKGIDSAAVDCLSNLEYEVPNFEVEYVRIDTPVPVGFWRSVGASHNAFTIESFMDEMAHLAGKDPLEFRLGLLKKHKRAHRVLEAASDKAGWGRPVSKGEGRGIAWSFAFGTYAAEVAEVSVDRKDGAVRVHRVIAAVDCGPVVNPAIITAQIKGAIIMGLSAALKERVDFARGGVASSNFDDYHLLRMSEIPEIEVHIVKSSDAMGGIGEPGLPAIAPAVGNAVFNATGKRLRNLPMTPETLKKALGKA